MEDKIKRMKTIEEDLRFLLSKADDRVAVAEQVRERICDELGISEFSADESIFERIQELRLYEKMLRGGYR